jgi:hypothetical protein
VNYIVGLDLGQAADYTAVAILKRTWGTVDGKAAMVFEVPHLHRYHLGTSYPDIAEDVKTMLARSELRGAHLVVDETGVGKPVLDVLRGIGLSPVGITITGGFVVNKNDSGWTVPKRDLISSLQAVLQSRRLKVAAELPHAATLIKELSDFRVKINLNAHDSYEAWREGAHDDLVLAVALATWFGARAVAGSPAVGGHRPLGARYQAEVGRYATRRGDGW